MGRAPGPRSRSDDQVGARADGGVCHPVGWVSDRACSITKTAAQRWRSCLLLFWWRKRKEGVFSSEGAAWLLSQLFSPPLLPLCSPHLSYLWSEYVAEPEEAFWFAPDFSVHHHRRRRGRQQKMTKTADLQLIPSPESPFTQSEELGIISKG